MRNSMLITAIILGSLFLLYIFREILPLSVSSRHVLHLIFQPKDLYKPIVIDYFSFYKKGYTKTYSLKPKYLDYYALSFKIKSENTGEYLKYKGVLNIKILSKSGETLLESNINIDDQTLFKQETELFNFPLPVSGKHSEVNMRVEVLEPDTDFEKYGENINLVIGVSGRK